MQSIDVAGDPFSEANRGYGFAKFRIISAPRTTVGYGAQNGQFLAAVRGRQGNRQIRFPANYPRSRGNRGQSVDIPIDPFPSSSRG